MDMKIYLAILDIRELAIENINEITMEHREALSSLKYLSNLGGIAYGAGGNRVRGNVDTESIVKTAARKVKVLVPVAKEDWEFELLGIWNDLVIDYVNCTICTPSEEDIKSGRNDITLYEPYRTTLKGNKLSIDLDYDISVPVNFCPKCGRKIGDL